MSERVIIGGIGKSPAIDKIHRFSKIWRGKLKKVENLEMFTVGRGIWQDN